MKHSSPLSLTLHFLSSETRLPSTHLADFRAYIGLYLWITWLYFISWFWVLKTIYWLRIMVVEKWILSCSNNPQYSPQLPYSALCTKMCLSFPFTLPIVLHFNFVQINIQCLYYMAMQMILISKPLLFLLYTLFLFSLEVLFCFIFTFRLHYILLY